MIVDTSVLAAILLGEEGWQKFIEKIVYAPQCFLSAASYVELGIVYRRKLQKNDFALLDSLLGDLAIEVIAVTRQHAKLAMQAYARYGKGLHPAALNFGDCFAYALAISLNAPLLFKGDDFSKTDVQAA